MRGTTAICLAALLAAAPAAAADQDTQVWLTSTITAPLGRGVTGLLDLS